MALDGSGKLYVGGTFTNAGGQSRNNLARLSTSGTGAADAGWNPNADASVAAFALDTSGSVYVGGTFFHIGGLPRGGIARLSVATGAADPIWDPEGFGVDAIALDGNGHVYVGGGFYGIGGSGRSHAARLSTGGIGAADCTWIADADSSGVGARARRQWRRLRRRHLRAHRGDFAAWLCRHRDRLFARMPSRDYGG